MAQAQANPSPGFARHPGHTITLSPNPATVVASVDGAEIARSANVLTMHEGDYPPVQYFPRADVNEALLEATDHTSHCPFKGDASYWSIRAGEQVLENAVWGYEAPYDEMAQIAGYVAFYSDRVTISEA